MLNNKINKINVFEKKKNPLIKRTLINNVWLVVVQVIYLNSCYTFFFLVSYSVSSMISTKD